MTNRKSRIVSDAEAASIVRGLDALRRGRVVKPKGTSEAHIQATCTAWLELDGWRCVHTDMPHLRGLGVSELGMADNLYIRYAFSAYGPAMRKPEEHDQRVNAMLLASGQDVLWIEWKKRGGKAAQHQKDWHHNERARGALTLIAGEDFPASIEEFCNWYKNSGLQRKSISIPR